MAKLYFWPDILQYYITSDEAGEKISFKFTDGIKLGGIVSILENSKKIK